MLGFLPNVVGLLPYNIKHIRAIVVATWQYMNKTDLN